MTLYYIAINQKQQGPFTIEELKRMNLPTQTLVWYKGLKNWIPISNVKELSEDTPPPLPTEHTAVEIMTNSPIQIELLKQKSQTKDFHNIAQNICSRIKSAFVKGCILFFKSLCAYLILLLIAGVSTYLYTLPPKINKQNQLEYNKEVAERESFVNSLLDKYGRSYRIGNPNWKKENDIIKNTLQEKGWQSELFCIATNKNNLWDNNWPYDRKIVHIDLLEKYLNINKVEKWRSNWHRYINYDISNRRQYFWGDYYDFSNMNESLKRTQNGIFWNKEIFPFQAIFCIFIIVAFWIIKLLVHFIKWVKLNAKSENG